MPQADKTTSLSPEDEKDFRRWYQNVSAILGIDPNPDSPEHYYDYRRAYQSGFDPLAASNPSRHWPSEYKYSGHPREYLYDPDTKDILNTTTGEHGFFKHMKSSPSVESTPPSPPTTVEKYLQAADNLANRGNNLLARLIGRPQPYPQLEPKPRTPIVLDAPRVSEPTPTPAPTPAPTLHRATSNADNVGPTDTGSWNVFASPRLRYVGGTGSMESGIGYKGWGEIGQAEAMLRRRKLPGLTAAEIKDMFIALLKEDTAQQIAGGMTGYPMYMVQGDPFNNNIKDVNLPKNAPISGERLFWKERAL